LGAAPPVREQAKVADADEAAGHDMQQKPPQKFVGG
jgi:hypothetical protein